MQSLDYKKSSKVGLVLGLLIILAQEKCLSNSNGASPFDWPVAKADKLWSRPAFLSEYENALKLLRNGKGKEAQLVIRHAASASPRLAPDNAWDDSPYLYGIYLSGRLSSSVTLMRNVLAANRDYAMQLSNNGKGDEALGVFALNLMVARQMIHLQPVEMAAVIGGNTIWRVTWSAIAKELEDAGRKADTQTASQCVEKSKPFAKSYVSPLLKKQKDRSEALRRSYAKDKKELEKKTLENIQIEQSEVRELIKRWDKEVDAENCRCLLEKIGEKPQ